MTKAELQDTIDMLEDELACTQDEVEELKKRLENPTDGQWVPLHKPEDTSEHYKEHHGLEVIDFVTSNNLPFTAANVVKYIARFQKSGKWEGDLRKAEIYLKWTRDLVNRGVIEVV